MLGRELFFLKIVYCLYYNKKNLFENIFLNEYNIINFFKYYIIFYLFFYR